MPPVFILAIEKPQLLLPLMTGCFYCRGSIFCCSVCPLTCNASIAPLCNHLLGAYIFIIMV